MAYFLVIVEGKGFAAWLAIIMVSSGSFFYLHWSDKIVSRRLSRFLFTISGSFQGQWTIRSVMLPIQATSITKYFLLGTAAPKWTLGWLAMATDWWRTGSHILRVIWDDLRGENEGEIGGESGDPAGMMPGVRQPNREVTIKTKLASWMQLNARNGII